MAEIPSETISTTENIYNELSKMRTEGLYCRKCGCYCITKYEFNRHLEEHLKEENSGKENFMSYIEQYICSKCGQQFEVKSDLIIHYNTVCTDALYICKHCKENCENSSFLQMHLVVHHRYSEEMLRDEGFLFDIDDNPFFSRCSFMTSFKRKAFMSSSTEVKIECGTFGSLTSIKASYSKTYRTPRKSAITRQNLAFNLLDKSHTCQICNESFSRKCVLEIHVQKHTSENSREKKMNRSILERSVAMKDSENNCNLTINAVQVGESIPVVSGSHSNGQRAILKPSNVVLKSSSVWKKVKPSRKIGGVKRNVSTTVATRKNKKKATKQNAGSTKAISQPSDKSDIPVTWKKIKLKSKTRNVVASNERKDSENLNKTKKSKYSDTKQCKDAPKNVGKQEFACEVCKKPFKDGYKLRRHFLIHTGVRPYTCTECKKTFTRDDHLKRHIKRVCGKTAKSPLKSDNQ